MDFTKDFKVTKEEGSQVRIEGEIPFAELEKERSKAIAHLGTNIELDGFRKGHVPEEVLVGKIGEATILAEMAERALSRVYPEVLKEHNIEAIGHPQVQITKIAPDNPLGFTATVAVIPEITLPDYKKIAAEVNKEKGVTEVTDEEVEAQAKDIIRQKVAYERLQKKAVDNADKPAGSKNDGLDEATELPTPESEAKKESTEDEKDMTPADDELPELTDAYVQSLGQPGQFESVGDFKAKLRQHLEVEKAREVSAAHRGKITDKIIEETGMELPQVLIDSEMNQMFAQMEEDLKRAGLSIEDYLGHIKKSKEDLAAEWKPAAEKRAKLQLVLNKIGKKEEIKPDEGQVESQVEQLMEQYKDADKERVRVYVASVMTNEAVMQMLETQ